MAEPALGSGRVKDRPAGATAARPAGGRSLTRPDPRAPIHQGFKAWPHPGRMGDVVTKDEAAREAVAQLGLLTSEAIPTIARLLQDEMRDHPRAIATAYRKESEQISDNEKKALGIRKNGFLSRVALAELTSTGRIEPLVAHETTLLRATFTLNRYRCIAQEKELQAQLGKCFLGFEHETLHRDCPACNRLSGLVTQGAEAAILPPADCIRGCTASYGLRAKIDWLANID